MAYSFSPQLTWPMNPEPRILSPIDSLRGPAPVLDTGHPASAKTDHLTVGTKRRPAQARGEIARSREIT